MVYCLPQLSVPLVIAASSEAWVVLILLPPPLLLPALLPLPLVVSLLRQRAEVILLLRHNLAVAATPWVIVNPELVSHLQAHTVAPRQPANGGPACFVDGRDRCHGGACCQINQAAVPLRNRHARRPTKCE